MRAGLSDQLATPFLYNLINLILIMSMLVICDKKILFDGTFQDVAFAVNLLVKQMYLLMESFYLLVLPELEVELCLNFIVGDQLVIAEVVVER